MKNLTQLEQRLQAAAQKRGGGTWRILRQDSENPEVFRDAEGNIAEPNGDNCILVVRDTNWRGQNDTVTVKTIRGVSFDDL